MQRENEKAILKLLRGSVQTGSGSHFTFVQCKIHEKTRLGDH